MMKLTVPTEKILRPDGLQCVGLPAIITRGKTEEEALRNIKAAIELVLEENRTRQKSGRKVNRNQCLRNLQSYQEKIVELLGKESFVPTRQSRGSHVFLRHPDGKIT